MGWAARARAIAPWAAAALLCTGAAAAAQEAPPLPPADATIDPASPLAPLPDLGVAWPDLAAPDAPLPADLAPDAAPQPASPAPGVSTAPAPVAAAPQDQARERRYRVALAGVNDVKDEVKTLFDQLSTLKQGEGKAANIAQIERRAQEDEQLLVDLLRSAGYYDGRVSTGVSDREGVAIVTLTAEPGAAYTFSSVALPGLEAAGAAKTPVLRAAFGLGAGDLVEADRVNAAVLALKTALGREGFPFAKVGDPDVTVDHDTQKASLSVAVTTGPAARFGRILVRGTPLFAADHIQRIARFRPGEPYDAAMVDDLRRALIATTLVSSVTLEPVRTADAGVVDIAVRLERAPPRTIAGELGYSTGEGVRAEVSWQHRNLIKPEGAVTFRGVAGTREQSLGASLRRANFHARDQVLTAQVLASNSKLNAYDAKTFTLAAGLERQTNIIWQKTWTWSFGAELLASDERDAVAATGQRRRRTFLIAALPTSLAYDGSDDLLNPTRGHRLSGRLSPEASLQNGSFGYLRAQIDGSKYLPITSKWTLAGRVRLGAIAGASRDRIAPSRRFYSGGGGSVRGYSYQAIGPRDANGDPIGGRSLAEFSIEARVRLGDFGIVPFFDAGNIYTTPYPKLNSLRYGAGLGVRYYTSFGPIRVDVGTPINPRSGDSRVAVYVSLGQAF